MTKYGIWCIVSGGVTGRREAWMKGPDGKPELFETYHAAAAEADSNFKRTNNALSKASFEYLALEYND